jgi:hypothetical protein
MEAIHFSDKPVNIFRVTLYHIPEDYKLASGLCAGIPPAIATDLMRFFIAFLMASEPSPE